MRIVGIRGAITVEQNTAQAISEATVELVGAILEGNNLTSKDLAFINFSATKDLTAAYPAKFVRTELGITDVPMMCYQEMNVEGSLEKCIRVLIVISTINNEFSAKHFYLKDAEKLRPDLQK